MVTVKFTIKGRPEITYPELEALEGKYSKKEGYYSKPSYSFKQIRRDMRAEFKRSGEKPFMIKHSRGTPRASIPSFRRMHRRRIFEIPKEKPTSYGKAKPIHRVIKKRIVKKRVIKKRKRRVVRLVRKKTRRKKLGRPRKRTRARHYGDNPKIRRTHGERKYNPSQPWERAYRKRKRKLKRLKRKR